MANRSTLELFANQGLYVLLRIRAIVQMNRLTIVVKADIGKVAGLIDQRGMAGLLQTCFDAVHAQLWAFAHQSSDIALKNGWVHGVGSLCRFKLRVDVQFDQLTNLRHAQVFGVVGGVV